MADDEAPKADLRPPRLFGRGKGKQTEPVELEKAAPPVAEPAAEPAAKPAAVSAAGATAEPETYEEMVPAPAAPAKADASSPAGTVPQASPTTKPVIPTRAPTPEKRPRRTVALPTISISQRAGAALAGFVTGVLLIALTFGGFGICESVQGTSSCGTGMGSGLLFLVLALAVVAGRFILAAFKVPDPGSTSFLAVGLLSIVVLLFLIDHLDSTPVLIVLPFLTAAAFLASYWVTTTYVDPADHG